MNYKLVQIISINFIKCQDKRIHFLFFYYELIKNFNKPRSKFEEGIS